MQNVLKTIASYMQNTPDKIAIVDRGGKRTITYGQLDELSGKIAAEILKSGCQKASAIPILLPRCAEYIASELAVMRAGCAFVPLITEYPDERVQYIKTLCKSEIVIDTDFIKRAESNEPVSSWAEVKSEDSSYFVFTSGSTGNPKGIHHTHRSFNAFVNGNFPVFGLNSDDVYLDTVTHSFIASKLYYISLSAGASVHILTNDERKNIHFLEDYILRHGITIAVISPAQHKVFKNKSKSLKQVISTGERLSNEYSDDYRIINCYGASETHGSMYFCVDKKYENTPIGKPFINGSAYVLDENGNEVADGEEGELCVSGENLAQGYIGLDEQTKKVFVPNPFSKGENDKILYHTGDVVKRLPDGNVVYLNRKDWMVKINGQRVETGEIEIQTSQIDGVSTAVVKAFENEYGQNYLVNYYKSDRKISAEQIKEHLKNNLPDYMIPSFFVQVESFPLNSNGKLDRKSLAAPTLSDFKAEYVAPETETQQKLCDGFEKILNCGKIGINDNFFELGGDSIKVMKLQNECGISCLTTAIIFEGKTPCGIASLLEQGGEDIFAQCLSEKLDSYPLTPSQMGVYLACVQNPNGTMYNTPGGYAFKKHEVDTQRLIDAIKKAVSNHAALKIYIDNSSGSPMMKPRNDFEVVVPVIKTDNIEQAKIDFVKPFDIQKDLLFRFAIFENGEDCFLAMDFHHIVFDGTSVSVICKEISLAYDGKAIPPEQLTQLDLALYEEKVENTEKYTDAKAYYDSVFSGVDAKSELTADFAEDKNVENKPCGEFSVFVGDKLSAANAESFAHEIGVTVNTLFLGAYEYAVSKFTGQSETVICTVNHGRHDSRMQNTVGMMVRTLPLYSNINEEIEISDFLLNVQDNLQNSIKHDSYPFVKLASEYDISADIMLAYQSDAFNSFKLGDVELKLNSIPVESSLAKLNIMIFKTEGGFELRFEYRSDLYSEETVRSFADTYVKILEELMCKKHLCEIELIDSSQKVLLDEFNDNEVSYDLSKTIIDLFDEQTKKTPESTAVVYKETKLTYAELDRITDRVADFLHTRKIGREDVISVLIPRCEYMAIASIGVLKSGAAYQPLDPSYPPERLQFMIKDSSAKLLIADESLLNLLPEYNGEVLLTKDIPALPKLSEEIQRPAPSDLFVMLYTSGSTGTPKGAMLEHGNIAAFCEWYRTTFELNESSVASAYASYGFDACLCEMYPALTSGATLHIIDEDIRLDLVKVNKYYEDNGVTHAFMTTQVARQFATEIDNKSLKYFLTGGERLVPFEPKMNYKMYNLYGPTECTVCITGQLVDKFYHRIPIGKGNTNLKLYVVDKYNRRLPVGALGELCASGRQVSRGYLNRPEQTAKAYCRNPFSDEAQYKKLYRTGDIVRFMPDGRVDFVGRNDGQVKIRGFRIELSEVEKVIREYDGITDATVVAQKLPAGGMCINAYIVANQKINIEKLNEFIAQTKPPYMVPAATMQIDKIPLNVNGKVDKRKLPQITSASSQKKSTAPTERKLTLLEKKISEIVEKIIGHNEFDVAENLISAGMTSLSVIKLAVELNKAFGFEANVKQMMKGCTILSIEDELQEYMFTKAAAAAQPEQEKVKKIHKELYPLSKTQLGVYLDCMKNPYSTVYNIPSYLVFPKSFDADRLADCVKQVIKAHPYIATHLSFDNDDIMQAYVDKVEFEIPVQRLSQQQFEELKKGYVKPHNLMKAPLFGITLVETENNIYLLTDFHHIIFDGASVALFTEQIKTLYEGGSIKPEEYTYFDYIENETAAENGEEYRKAEEYFDNMLKDFEASTEITADLHGHFEDGALSMVSVPIDMKRIESFCSQNELTPAHLFLAAAFYTVSRFANSRNVYLSTISNGRSDMRLTNCFGMFVKTLAIAVDVDDISSIEFAKKSKSVLTDSIANENFPYSQLCSKYGYAPNIVYEYQLGVVDDLVIDGSKIQRDYLEMNTSKFKVAIHIEEYNGTPSVVVQYNDALYSQGLMQTLAQSVACAANNIIANPNGRIRNVSLLSDKQLKQIKEFSTTQLGSVETTLLHKMFENQVDKTPDVTALVACDESLTYSELERLSNITANSLLEKGLQKGGRVVLLLERTSRFFTSLIGVLKAGGAFIPTCPDYPKERIESIISDSDADFIITEGSLLSEYENTVDVEELLSGTNDSRPDVGVDKEDLAYLIYTSGSTGKPKGVMLRHIGISNYLTYNDANIQVKRVVDNCKVYGSVTTISFDMSLKETLLSLCNGLTLVFASEDETVNPLMLAKLFKKNKVDAFNSTPSRLLQYLELDSFAEAMADCKVILSGGEKYPDKLLKILREKTNAIIINTYGPTEITVSSNAKELRDADIISVGKPLFNYREYIVDSDNNLLPVGVVGELLISGCGVALGYNKLPEQTKKAFIEFNGERTYRSGDYAKWTDNGDVVILGRTDNQVKLRGLRIELGEIEKALTNITDVKNAVALIKKVGNSDAICAYYTADTPLDDEAIKTELKKHLTDYMIPSAYIQLDAMPLTPNGKVNTKALPEPLASTSQTGALPKNELEKTFCNIFAEILELDAVYADSSFFDIGGTSLTVTRVVIEAGKKNLDIAYSDVFANPSPQALAKLVAKSDDVDQDELEISEAFDYSEIDSLLKSNTIESFINGEKQPIGNVLLTGPTGFLGIHILYELLHRYSGKVYCLIRDKNNNPASERLNSIYYYYFEESLKEAYSERVIVVNGDITKADSFDKLFDYDIDIVINCAANVKHFSKGTDIEDVNLYGTLNVLEFCKKSNTRLVHVSTMSVGGMYVGESGPVKKLEETQLYFGQHQGSKYTRSKFLAERAILSEAAKGLNAKIMRVGTLAARNSDGEYQINFTTNTFMGRLKSTLLIGKYPYEAMDMPFELSPIDFVAKAILLLAQTPKECTVFHPFNNHTLIMGDLYTEMNRIGLHSQAAEYDEYLAALEKAEQDPEKAEILSSMIAYQNMARGQKTFSVGKSNRFTMQVLYRMGFIWPVTSLDYMKRFINALRGLGFFD